MIWRKGRLSSSQSAISKRLREWPSPLRAIISPWGHLMPVWGLEKEGPLPNSDLYASIQGIAREVEATIQSPLFPLVWCPCTENIWICPAWEPLWRVLLNWCSGDTVNWMGLDTGISSGLRVTKVHAGQSKTGIGLDFSQVSHCMAASAHSCTGCASGTFLFWEIKAMDPFQLKAHF